MGFMRALYILATIIIVPTLLYLILSVDLWTAFYNGCVCVVVFGLIVGIVAAYKLRSNITRGYASDDETFIKMLVSDINHAHRTVRIVECDENIHLYNDDRVVKAFCSAVERGVSIKFVLKPAINGLVRE